MSLSMSPNSMTMTREGILTEDDEEGVRKYILLLQDALAIKFTYLNALKDNERAIIGKGSEAGAELFKEFIDANLPCIWNPGLQQTFLQLEYKGTILPSTILVGSSAIKHLHAVKTAYAQKILKAPNGTRIEFTGEIEELLADPVEKCQFVPLSDSICWAIHRLTSSGQGSFVDEILGELGSNFPDTVLPPKELLYQVLERLTKANKVYQTSRGYFIQNGQDQSSSSPTKEEEKEEDEDDIYKKADDASKHFSLKRWNSLRKQNQKVTGCLPRRTFSLKKKRAKETETIKVSQSSPKSSSESLVLSDKRRKRTRKSCDGTCIESSTQTGLSLENLRGELSLLSVSTGSGSRVSPSGSPTSSSSGRGSCGPGPSSPVRGHDSDSGRFTEISDHSITSHSQKESSSENKPCEEFPQFPRPSSSLSSSSYLFNNPYRRRYLGYQFTNKFSPTQTPTPLKYPPRPFEKRQIYEKLYSSTKKIHLASPSPTLMTNPTTTPTPKVTTTTTTTTAAAESEVQLELLLPLGKLINQVLADFDEKKSDDTNQSQNQNLLKLKSLIKSSSRSSESGNLSSNVNFSCNSELGLDVSVKKNCAITSEAISYKPRMERESEII